MLTVLVILVVSGALVAGAVWGIYGTLSDQVEGLLVALAGGALIISAVLELIDPATRDAVAGHRGLPEGVQGGELPGRPRRRRGPGPRSAAHPDRLTDDPSGGDLRLCTAPAARARLRVSGTTLVAPAAEG